MKRIDGLGRPQFTPLYDQISSQRRASRILSTNILYADDKIDIFIKQYEYHVF